MAIGVEYIGAAIIAASAAFIGMVLGKEQKTTEFRQDWINAQRGDLACMIGLARSAGELPDADRQAALRQFDEADVRVHLRENPDKPEWAQMLEALRQLRPAVAGDPFCSDVAASCTRVIDLSQQLLKREWTRVRAGEPWFRVSIRLLPPLVCLTALALAYGQGFIVIG